MSLCVAALLAAESAAVLVTGTNVPPAAIAKVQADTEARLAPGFAIVPAMELGARIGGVTSAPETTAVRKETQALIDAATKSIYAGANADALATLAKAAELQEKTPALPTDDRVSTALWRVTALLENGNDAAAREAALDVVRLTPADYSVSLDTFAPNVEQAVDAARAGAPAAVPVTFAGFPDAAEVLLDDRPVAGRRTTAIPGKHWIRVRAKGMNEIAWEATITAPATAIEPRAMSVAPSTEIASRLEPADGSVEPIARAAGVDAIAVLAMTREELRVRTWSARTGAASKTFGARETAAARTWIARTLAGKGAAPVATATPRPGYASAESHVRASGGPRLAFLTRRLAANGVSGVGVELTGTGGALDARWSRKALAATGELWIVSFAPTTATADLGTVRAHAPGGTLVGARATGGVSTFGGVALALGASFERYQANALPVDEDVPLFASQTRIAPELRASYHIMILELGLGIAPVTFVSESPAGTTGGSPKGGLGVDWRVGATAPVGGGDAWRVGLRYDGAMHRTSFEGPSSAPFDPPVENANLREISHVFTISAVRRF